MGSWRFALLLCAPGLVADQVILKNGDRVTGAIVKKDDQTLTIKTLHFGTVTAAWDQVAELRTDEPVSVEVAGGEIMRGRVEVGGGRIAIVADDRRRELPAGDVVALRDNDEQRTYERLLRPRWVDLWAGGATIGLAGTRGNAETSTFTAGFNAARITRMDKTTVYFSAIRASARALGIDTSTAQAVRGGWSYNRNIDTRLFVSAFNDYEYDRFQALDLRFVLGGGLGYMAWQGERGRLDTVAGLAFNREKFSPASPEPGFTRESAEAYVGDDLTYKLNSITSLYQNARFFTNLTNGGEYRFNFDSGANTRLFRWLTWNLSISNRYLSNPVTGRKNNDFLYTTGIGVAFAR